MKNFTMLITAAFFGTTVFAGSALAENKPLVPGSDASITATQTESREDVANGTDANGKMNDATATANAAAVRAEGTSSMKDGANEDSDAPNSKPTDSPMKMQQAAPGPN